MEPPAPPPVRYFYSKTSAQNVCFLYRVIKSPKNGTYRCFPEARGWPPLTMAEEDLDRNFVLLQPGSICTHNPEECSSAGEVKFPNYDQFQGWQLGRSVYFRHSGERTYGIVVGRFVWLSSLVSTIINDDNNNNNNNNNNNHNLNPNPNLRLLVLIQKRTNKLILSSEVTDLEFDNGDMAKNREDVYIQGISLVGIVATLIANVTYVASVTPPRGLDAARDGVAFASHLSVPTIFLFFNAVAFYASVLSVVLMTALIPIYGTAGEWGAIFLSSSLPVILSLVSFYVAFMVSSWATMDSWGGPLGMSILGVIMVLYIRFWAVELMHGHIDRSLHIYPKKSPWRWYLERGGDALWQRLPGRLDRFRKSFRTLTEVVEPGMWQHQFLGLGLRSRGIANRRTNYLFRKSAESLGDGSIQSA